MATASSSDPIMKSEASGGDTSESAAAVVGKGNSYHQQLMVKYSGLKKSKKDRGCTAKERISKMPPCAAGKRSSIYRGVTRHRWTGRYEAHLWDKNTWNQNQNKKGKQGSVISLCAYDDEEAAARAYDLAALKYWGLGHSLIFRSLTIQETLKRCKTYQEKITLHHSEEKVVVSQGEPLNVMEFQGDDATTESEYVVDFAWIVKSILHHILNGGDQISPVKLNLKEGKQHKKSSVSAMSILSRSAAYKSLLEKASKKEIEKDVENDENEKKNNINKMDYGKAVEKSSDDGASEGFGLGLGMELERNTYPLAPSYMMGCAKTPHANIMIQRRRQAQIIVSSNKRTCYLHDPSNADVFFCPNSLQQTLECMCNATENRPRLSHTALEQEKVARCACIGKLLKDFGSYLKDFAV
ncbi:hypothetical protein E3N88_46285 [Mikania micrantha]|uniref:AP2/ERF domain-containing protein n=1 Tax=Mikania micrantha TaxID=192012 RepID=A0A5N6L6N3_9ASTR|nr:hypothetical protein E3N88_46285 [Mikania micrantha]